jgi:hypothetical protein
LRFLSIGETHALRPRRSGAGGVQKYVCELASDMTSDRAACLDYCGQPPTRLGEGKGAICVRSDSLRHIKHWAATTAIPASIGVRALATWLMIRAIVPRAFAAPGLTPCHSEICRRCCAGTKPQPMQYLALALSFLSRKPRGFGPIEMGLRMTAR